MDVLVSVSVAVSTVLAFVAIHSDTVISKLKRYASYVGQKDGPSSSGGNNGEKGTADTAERATGDAGEGGTGNARDATARAAPSESFPVAQASPPPASRPTPGRPNVSSNTPQRGLLARFRRHGQADPPSNV